MLNRYIAKTLIFFGLFLFVGCQENSITLVDSTETTSEPNVFRTNYFKGIIRDAHGAFIENANVVIGDESTSSDINGFFQINASVLEKGAKIQVEKEGYFKVIANVTPQQDGENIVHVILNEKSNPFIVNSNSASTIDYLGNKIQFEENSFIDENGEAYEGDVKVYVRYIDPSLESISQILPGDLLALRINNERVILKSLGMLEVELYSTNNKQLNINKPAQLSIKIPDSELTNAPDEIPFWFLNEDSAIWKEEGFGVKEGSFYIGEVNHFTLWNCDVPMDYVLLTGTVESISNLEGRRIKVTSSALNSWRETTINKNGMFQGLVPSNDELLIEIVYPCNEFSSSMIVETGEEDLETIMVINDFDDWVTIEGRMMNCNGYPVENGYAVLSWDGEFEKVLLHSDENGNIQTDLPKCSNEFKLTIFDLDEERQNIQSFTVDDDYLNFGTIEACEETVSNIKIQFEDQSVTYYLVFAEEGTIGSKPFTNFSYKVNVENGSSFTTDFEFWPEGFVFDENMKYITQFSEIIGTPTEAYEINHCGTFEMIHEDDDIIEIVFTSCEIREVINNESYSSGTVKIIALK